MKLPGPWAATALFVAASGVSSVASAALVDRGGGLIYDTDYDITWLADANYAQTSGYDSDGLMTWSDAMTWAGNLSYGGYTDWALPFTLQPDSTCSLQDPGNDIYGGYNCTGSMMGHLFYTELGGAAGQDIATTHNANYNLFQNVQSGNVLSDRYWSSSGASGAGAPYFFGFSDGLQGVSGEDYYAWAVRPGDVAAVPVPATAWLFGSGLLGLIGVARRKARSA